MNKITIDIDKLEQEFKSQELFLEESEWNGIIASIKRAELDDFEALADEMIEKKYQLRIEHNHGDMKWYAYYAGKGGASFLFDDDDHYITMSDTPTEALQKLKNSCTKP